LSSYATAKEKVRSPRVWTQGATRRFGITKLIHLDVTEVDNFELRTLGDDDGSTAEAFGDRATQSRTLPDS
jgi:hypothetical protein